MTMTRRNVPATTQRAVPEHAYTEWSHGRKVLTRGDVVRVAHERGLFTVQWFRSERAGFVAMVFGGYGQHQQWRAFNVDRLTLNRRATREAHGE